MNLHTLTKWIAIAILTAPGVLAGTIWFEAGSAGRLPATAQLAMGGGALDGIAGNLTTLTEVDMYLIRIADPLLFSAVTVDSVFNVNDPQIFLFNFAGIGVFSNDDGSGIGSQSELPAGHPLGPGAAGVYYLAIGWFNNEPFSAAGPVFEDGVGVNGPDPVGGSAPVIGWTDDVTGRLDLPTAYELALTGAEFVPEPGTLLLIPAGLALLAFRRRRR